MKKLLNSSAALLTMAVILNTATAFAAAPIVTGSSDKIIGPWPLTVQFTASAYDPDGRAIVRYHWYFADGYTSEEQNPSHTYSCYGIFRGLVTVYDAQGETGSAAFTIVAQQVMFSDSIALTPAVKYQKTKTGSTPSGGTLSGAVLVKTTEGYTVPDATVQATWRTPSGLVTQAATTDASGVALFSVAVPKGGSGTYVLQIDGIAKTDFFFDASLGAIAASTSL